MLKAHAPKIDQVEQALYWWLLLRRGEREGNNEQMAGISHLT